MRHVLALAAALSLAQSLPAQPSAPAATPGPAPGARSVPANSNDVFYALGPDSKPIAGVPTGKFSGPKVIPSKVFPGTHLGYTWGIGNHGQKQGGAIFPEMMRWLWRDQPVSTDPYDTVERSFRLPAPVTPAPATESAANHEEKR